MAGSTHLAFDLGAESGRTLLGRLDGGKLEVQELNRFPNKMLHIAGHLHWDVFQLFEEMKAGMTRCVRDEGIQPDSVGVAKSSIAERASSSFRSTRCSSSSPWSETARRS